MGSKITLLFVNFIKAVYLITMRCFKFLSLTLKDLMVRGVLLTLVFLALLIILFGLAATLLLRTPARLHATFLSTFQK